MARVYRHIDTPIFLWGLELMDWLGVVIVFFLSFFVSRHILVNLLLIGSTYVILRFFKKGRAPNYAFHLWRFIRNAPSYYVRLEGSLPKYLHTEVFHD